MPIFEFVCKSCDSKFETLVMSAQENINCSCCGSDNLDKQFSSFASHSVAPSESSDISDMPSSASGCCGGGCACGH